MENLKKVTRAQWCLFVLLIGFAFLMQNCNEDDVTIFEENQTETELNAKPVKVTVCRLNSRKGTYSEVTLLEKRLQPGDVIIDADGDGYAADNNCNMLNGFDCNDNNPAINPGAVEICGDEIDNNCNGETDEVCGTYVPDNNFEQALIDLGYDIVLDNYVHTPNINAVTSLDVSSKSISDLTGIEDFVALLSLTCNNNNLTSLDVSENLVLRGLYCSYNDLPSLNVSNNPDLRNLYCNNNIRLTSLDVSNNEGLAELQCNGNNLYSLTMSAINSLYSLQCYDNDLTSINVSSHTNLYSLVCDNNDLASINITNNTNLRYLVINDNLLTSLDVSSHPVLTYLNCSNNIGLSCIKIYQDQNTSGWVKDDTAVYSTNCL